MEVIRFKNRRFGFVSRKKETLILGDHDMAFAMVKKQIPFFKKHIDSIEKSFKRKVSVREDLNVLPEPLTVSPVPLRHKTSLTGSDMLSSRGSTKILNHAMKHAHITQQKLDILHQNLQTFSLCVESHPKQAHLVELVKQFDLYRLKNIVEANQESYTLLRKSLFLYMDDLHKCQQHVYNLSPVIFLNVLAHLRKVHHSVKTLALSLYLRTSQRYKPGEHLFLGSDLVEYNIVRNAFQEACVLTRLLDHDWKLGISGELVYNLLYALLPESVITEIIAQMDFYLTLIIHEETMRLYLNFAAQACRYIMPEELVNDTEQHAESLTAVILKTLVDYQELSIPFDVSLV